MCIIFIKLVSQMEHYLTIWFNTGNLYFQFFLYPKKFLPENNPHHKEFHLRPYIQNNANQ